ncbi:patatin-like phospholipase family protein [Hyalangium rubrum]|uniref:Phospholipase n=1 Tax=Hyalangium rubrum TaxID=3103134 RepID=A0ABU5H670_9BACT|nr:patatin-like phospholipase family protein [Hyalangium sp. s54d21]MDY7228252.1 phospholipase [Hyalangium sp. s54d21]
MALPPLHFKGLSQWFEAHPERLGQLFELRSFPRETTISVSQAQGGSPEPRALVVISGELALTQVFPGCAMPHRPLYRGDLWINLNPSAAKRREPRASFRVESMAPSEVLLLSQAALDSLPEQEAKELEDLLEGYTRLERSRSTFFTALRKTVQLQRVGTRLLHALVDTADVRSIREAEGVVVPQGSSEEEHQGAFLVLDGHLGAWRDPEGKEGDSVLTHALYPGSLFGDVVLHSDAPAPSTVKLHSKAARVAFIPQRNSERLSLRSALYAGAIAPSPNETWQRGLQLLHELLPAPEVVLFRSEVPDAPLEVLVQDVAEATHQAYQDHILRVDLVFSSNAGSPEPRPRWQPGEVPCYRLRVANGQAAAEALASLAEDCRGEWDYLFVHVDPRLWPGLLPPQNRAHGFRPMSEGEVTWKLVLLSRDPLASKPPPGFDRDSTLYTALLAPRSELLPGPSLPAGTVRLRLELERFYSHRPFSQLPVEDQERFRRWGRGITERVVGVALGGGGAWGFAEIALIRGMHERNIPIDVVSGTSFGAAVGAFYSGMGLAGLDLMLKQGHVFPWVMVASVVNSSAMSLYVDRVLHHQRLERVEIPFFPVGTNVSESQAYVRPKGTLGSGVRSSGIMPGLLSPVFTDDHCRVVDGAFINSVPASVLLTQRANLTVAGNVLSDPPDHKDPGPLLPGPAGRFIHGLNPLGRLSDLVRSTLILFHTGGEQSSSCADVLYDSPFVPIAPWSFAEGQAFVDAAKQNLGPSLDDIEKRWKGMAQRRGDVLSQVRERVRSKMKEAVLRLGAKESA